MSPTRRPSTKDVVVKIPTDFSVYSNPGQMMKEGFLESLPKKVSILISLNNKLKKEVEKTKSDSERLAKESSEKLVELKKKLLD
ncbi:hypothetical protein Ddye_021088 [Dipteronia dyeriana]|uniref:Uncharacterized protein n=1 Tax=Dipteronia dyeriana TaxID=168575 RepID=A0AAD9U1S3_9ROSI|nr:hypothetical protein Ddye_021088 [Dipteronia dyeriana]